MASTAGPYVIKPVLRYARTSTTFIAGNSRRLVTSGANFADASSDCVPRPSEC